MKVQKRFCKQACYFCITSILKELYFISALLIFSFSPVFTFPNKEEIEDLGSLWRPSKMED